MVQITIKEGYIGYVADQQEAEYFGGYEKTNSGFKQTPFSKTEMLKRVKELKAKGYKILQAEILTFETDYDEDYDNESLDLVDPVSIVSIL